MALANDHPSDDVRNPGLATGPQRDLLAREGLVAPNLASPWGLDASAVQQVIIAEEFDKRPGLIRPSLGIAEWILPTILDSGTNAQRERFAGPILRGVQQWCQLFSEPGAGSDLASLATRAGKVDGGWIINGHKIWTSLANRAHFGAMLARTDPDAPKHGGIGYFLIDMTSPGIEVSPIKQASGRAEFNEVFFTDVFVPDDMLVGEADGGWGLAVSTMAVERTAIGNYVIIDRADALRRMAEVDGQEQDAALRALGDVEAYTTAIKALGATRNPAARRGSGRGPDFEHRQVRDGHAAASSTHRNPAPHGSHRDAGGVRPGRVSALLRCPRRTHRRWNPGDPTHDHRIDDPRAAAQVDDKQPARERTSPR